MSSLVVKMAGNFLYVYAHTCNENRFSLRLLIWVIPRTTFVKALFLTSKWFFKIVSSLNEFEKDPLFWIVNQCSPFEVFQIHFQKQHI
jgi:hypothetical protein